MFKDALNALFGRSSIPARPPAPKSFLPPKAVRPEPLLAPHSRHSLALAQFFANLEGRENLRILDLSGASQANLNFVLQYGHHLYCENFVSTMESVFGDDEDFYARQADEELTERFLSQTFANLHGPFDGALVWDSLQFLQPPLLDFTIGHLHRLLEPGALMFAFFPSDEKRKLLPVNSYRIESTGSIHVIPRGWRPSAQPYTSRTLERLFSDFTSVKFFLSRDGLRELIVTR